MTTLAENEERRHLTELQRHLHTWDGEVESIFGNDVSKCLWYSTGLVLMPGVPATSGNSCETVTYPVAKTWHYLIYSFMRITLPEVRVKSEFSGRVRIAWTRNVGTNIIVSADFVEDGLQFHSFDAKYCDCYFQFLQDPGFRKRHSRSVGNRPELIDWSEALPSAVLNVEQPWFYSLSTLQAFPIHERGQECRATHIYQLRTRVADLIRVQRLDADSSSWVDVYEDHGKYITGAERIPTPELWGRYGLSTEEELTQRRQRCNESSRYLYVRDVVRQEAKNVVGPGETCHIDLSSPHVCLVAFWVAENVKATAAHNYSNYTTCSSSSKDGRDSVVSNTLSYRGAMKFQDLPSDIFSDAEPRQHLKSAPNEEGYHAYSFAYYAMNSNPEVGVCPNEVGASLSCVISGETEDDLVPSLDTKLSSSMRPVSSRQGYKLHARLIVLKRITIKSTSKGNVFVQE